MLEFLRKLFGDKPSARDCRRDPLTKDERVDAWAARRKILPCCGKDSFSHYRLRSGSQACPIPVIDDGSRYNPLLNNFECFPSECEPGIPCDCCGCARGAHQQIGWLRRHCTDPDCPGCPRGCE